MTITVPSDSYTENEVVKNHVEEAGKEFTEYPKYYTGCGRELDSSLSFCGGCGEKI